MARLKLGTLIQYLIVVDLLFESIIIKTTALEVRACGGKKPLPLGVEVDGCEKEPCKVVNKKKIHFAIDFEAPEDTNTLKAHAEAYLDNVQLPYEVPKEDLNACKFLKNTECPIKKGQQIHYELIAPVDAPVTGPTVDLKFELKDEHGNSVFCIKAKVTIVER
uniref:CSON000565 protein n=1 Tax=Culicoides sonorensis TaxID=179676 RepID=A0A336K7E5_CULSO